MARLAITFGSVQYAADPGLWFGLLWGAHLFGMIIAGLVLVWLTWGSVAPRWAATVLGVFSVMALPFQASPPAYTGVGVYAAAVLWRNRRTVGSDVG